MASGGWQFSVTVPSWTQASLEGDENIVFYRVEVKVLPPEADAAPRTRSVLRRFNHFTKLYQRLKEELGNKKMAKLEPPSKNRLGSVNKRPDLVEKRRRELESWLWKLIGDGEIARSQVLNKFLELSDAARLVQRVMPAPQVSRPPSQSGSYAWSEGGSSSVHDSSQPSAASSFQPSNPHGPAGFDILPGRGLPPLQRSASDALQLPSNPQPPSQSPSQSFARSASAGGPPADPAAASDDQLYNNAASEADWFRGGGSQTGGSHAGGLHAEQPDAEEPHMRLGLRMHQRFAVQQHVKALQHQLDTAAGDLQDAMEAIFTERRNKRELALQLAGLQARASEAGILQAAAAQAETERSLQQQQTAAAQLQHDLGESTASAAQLRHELSEAQRELDLREQASAEQHQMTQKLQQNLQERESQVQKLDEQLANAERQTADAKSQLEERSHALEEQRGASAQLQRTLDSQSMQISRLERETREQEAAAAQAQAQLADSQQAIADEQEFSARLRQDLNSAQSQVHSLTSQVKQDQSQLRHSAQQFAIGQQEVSALKTQLHNVRQNLLHADQMQPASAADAAAAPAQQGLDEEALGSSDQPSVAPPQEGQKGDERLSHNQAEPSAHVDATVAALRAELAAYKQEVATADNKARGDRKLLAKEIKNLRKQLEDQREQAAVAEQPAPNTEPAAPVTLHIHVTSAAALPPGAATTEPQTANHVSAGATQPTELPSVSQAPANTQSEEADAFLSESEAPTLPETDADMSQTDRQGDAGHAGPSLAQEALAFEMTTAVAATQSGAEKQLAGPSGNAQQSIDLLTGSDQDSAATSSQVQQIPLTIDLLGMGPPPTQSAAAAVSDAQQPGADELPTNSLSVAPVDASVERQPALSAPRQASNSVPDVQAATTSVPAFDLLTDDAPSLQASTASRAATAGDAVPSAPSQADEAVPEPQRLAMSENDWAGLGEADNDRTSKEEAAAKQYKQLLQEVSALRQRLHACSVEALEGHDSHTLTPQQSVEVLSTCDGRLQALMAEADLLGQPVPADTSSTAEAALEAEIRQAFASILVESGSLRQQISTLLRDKFESKLHGKEAQQQQAADGGGLFQKFRPPGISFLNSQTNGGPPAGAEHASQRPAIGQALGERFAGFGDRFSKSFRPQQ